MHLNFHRSAEPVEARFSVRRGGVNLYAPFDRLRATVSCPRQAL
jgi:hypothetical protein